MSAKATLRIGFAILSRVGALTDAQHAEAVAMAEALEGHLEIHEAVRVAESPNGLEMARKVASISAARRALIRGELEPGEFERVLDTELAGMENDADELLRRR